MQVTLISGPNRLETEITGTTTVGDLRKEFSGALNIPANSAATVNGNAANDATRVRANDEVAFTKATGQKGR